MKILVLTLSFMLGVTTAGCGGGDSATSEYQIEAEEFDGMRGRFIAAGTYIARDQHEFIEIWASSRSLADPAGQPPTLDFTRTMILGVSAGAGPGCDGRFARIDTIREDAQTVYVEYRMQLDAQPPTPGISCHLTNFIPLTHFVAAPASPKAVVFKRKEA